MRARLCPIEGDYSERRLTEILAAQRHRRTDEIAFSDSFYPQLICQQPCGGKIDINPIEFSN